MALNYVAQQSRTLARRSQKQINAEDLIIVNRQQFALLWRKWSLNEKRLHDAISGLVYELSERLEKSNPATEASYEMMDLFFTDKEQHKLWLAWEKEDKEQYEKLKGENIKSAIEALKQLSDHQRATVIAETDEIKRGYFPVRQGIHDLVPRLEDEDAKEIYVLMIQKLGIPQ